MNPRVPFWFVLLAACQPRPTESSHQVVALDSTIASLEILKDSQPRLYPALRALVVIGVQYSLSRLGFGPVEYTGQIDAATEEATRRFEAARGLPITANPFAATTFGLLTSQASRADRLATAEPGTSTLIGKRYFLGGTWNDGYVSAEGPWIAAGVENPAAAKIECFRDRTQCIVAEAEYGEQLVPVIEYYDIQSWERVELRSKPVDNACQRSVLQINRVEESVIITRSALSTARYCQVMRRDTSVAFNHTAHLATNEEADSIQRQHTRVLLDSLVYLPPELRRSLAVLWDTVAMRGAIRTRSAKQ